MTNKALETNMTPEEWMERRRISKENPVPPFGEQAHKLNTDLATGLQKTPVIQADLHKEFPWLAELEPLTDELLKTLHDKERSYRGSWQKRGGVGAFMMLARKWDRIEGMASENGYDIFETQMQALGDVVDDIDDLISYLLLVRAEHRRREKLEHSRQQAMKGGAFRGYGFVGDGSDGGAQ